MVVQQIIQTGDSCPSKVSLEILADITSAQAQHGLKHADHLRYRRYCTRRLARIRAATQSNNKHPSHPRQYHAAPLTTAHILAHPRALAIPLVCAERAWAFAMDIKHSPPAGPARARRAVLSKLKSAVHYAAILRDLADHVADESTVLEAEAYLKSFYAALALEREQWSVALAAYNVVHNVYTGMAGMRAGTSRAALFEKRLEEVEQGIRFCKYNLARAEGADDAADDEVLHSRAADGTDVLAAKINAALALARKRAAQSFGEVVWCGIVVPLRAERVREAVLMATENSDSSTADTVDQYDQLFILYNDAIKVVSAELAEFRASSTPAEERVLELEYLVAYLTFNRLQYTISRNLLLVESFRTKRASKPDDFVRLYDNLIANMTDILALPGVDEDAAVFNEGESRRKLFRAYRCFHLAQCYQAAELQPEAASLFDRVSLHARSITGKYAAEASSIVAQSTGMKCRARAEAFLEQYKTGANGGDFPSEKGVLVRKSLMVDHLDTFESFAPTRDGARVIAEMPPVLEAVPCKPVLFDLAVDGLRFPDNVTPPAPEPKKVEPEQTTSSKFPAMSSTRFGRWWSGKS